MIISNYIIHFFRFQLTFMTIILYRFIDFAQTKVFRTLHKKACADSTSLFVYQPKLSLDLFHYICLKHVSDLDIVKSLKTDSALIALSDLLGVILEALQ